MGLSQDLGADLVYPSPAWLDRSTQLPGSLHRFPAFASFSGPPLFPRIAFFLSTSLSENLDLVHSKCSKTLRCCESVFMSISCCVLLSLLPSLCPFFPSCLSLSLLLGGNSQRLTGSLLQNYPAGQPGEPRWVPPPRTISVWPSALCLERPPPLIFSGDCAHPSVSNSNKSISCRQSHSVAFSVPTDVAWAVVESAHLERGGLLHGAWA